MLRNLLNFLPCPRVPDDHKFVPAGGCQESPVGAVGYGIETQRMPPVSRDCLPGSHVPDLDDSGFLEMLTSGRCEEASVVAEGDRLDQSGMRIQGMQGLPGRGVPEFDPATSLGLVPVPAPG